MVFVNARSIVFAGLLAAVGCSSSKASSPATPEPAGGNAPDGSAESPADTGPIGGDRPVTVQEPDNPNREARPLLVLLHGYTATAAQEDQYLGFSARAKAAGLYFVAPEGKRSASGKTYWNATDACCDFDHSNVDDSAYLRGVLTSVIARYPIDRSRVWVFGHSNGGFMAHRLACEHADVVTGIFSLAGDPWSDASRCKPSQKVNVLNIHGTADDTIAYTGGSLDGATYPAAPEVMQRWGALDGCTGAAAEDGTKRDYVMTLAGAETTVVRPGGCVEGGLVEHWRLQDGSHIPAFTASFGNDVFRFIADHPRP